jgi:hypothetical protein
VDARELSESYEIRCEPSQSHVSRLLVLVSPADPTPWEWTLVDGGENRVSTRLVAGSENGFSGDAWEVTSPAR